MNIFGPLLVISLFCSSVNASEIEATSADQSRVVAVVKNAENYIKKYGKEKAIIEFRKNSSDIVMGDYNARYLKASFTHKSVQSNKEAQIAALLDRCELDTWRGNEVIARKPASPDIIAFICKGNH